MSEETNNVEETTQVNPQEFLANFDWHKYEEGIEAVDESKLKEFEESDLAKQIKETFPDAELIDVQEESND